MTVENFIEEIKKFKKNSKASYISAAFKVTKTKYPEDENRWLTVGDVNEELGCCNCCTGVHSDSEVKAYIVTAFSETGTLLVQDCNFEVSNVS